MRHLSNNRVMWYFELAHFLMLPVFFWTRAFNAFIFVGFLYGGFVFECISSIIYTTVVAQHIAMHTLCSTGAVFSSSPGNSVWMSLSGRNKAFAVLCWCRCILSLFWHAFYTGSCLCKNWIKIRPYLNCLHRDVYEYVSVIDKLGHVAILNQTAEVRFCHNFDMSALVKIPTMQENSG